MVKSMSLRNIIKEELMKLSDRLAVGIKDLKEEMDIVFMFYTWMILRMMLF